MLLPFARTHLEHDWPALRAQLPLMVLLSATGFALNNALSYWALQYTQALNALLIQSSGPLFVGLWSLTLFGVRLTPAQLAGITLSLLGVLIIILHGDFRALASIQFNKGDLMFAAAIFAFGLYSALMPGRPKTHLLSLISFTTGCGALLLLPFSIWELSTGFTLKFDALTLATLIYVVIFPSTLAYLFFNRGIALIGPNRAAPFFHLIPVFGSAMAILLLGEQPHLFHLVGYLLVLAGVVIASRKASAAA
jgi:drug/metabolite transporter (DMT)-like permease